MNKKENQNIIKTSEDRLKLTLKEYAEIKNASAKLWTYIGILLSLVTTILTATFNSILGLSSEIIKALFIFFSILFFVLIIKESIKLIKSKINGVGDEEWVVLYLQNKSKPPKEHKKFKLSFMSILGRILQTLLYVLPILLWILVISLCGWSDAFGVVVNASGEKSITWIATIYFSLMWYLITYVFLIASKDYINKWFDTTFHY